VRITNDDPSSVFTTEYDLLACLSSLALPKLNSIISLSFPLVLIRSLIVSPVSEPLPRMKTDGDHSSVSGYKSINYTGLLITLLGFKQLPIQSIIRLHILMALVLIVSHTSSLV